jgi:hypothetical protein
VELALEEVFALWDAAQPPRGVRFELTPATRTEQVTQWQLSVELPGAGSGVALAKALPSGPDWALLRTLLLQSGPTSAQEKGLLWQEVTVSQPLDLHAVGDQWAAMAEGLGRQADQYDAQTTPTNRFDPTAAETALRAHIQAVNYRAAAQVWSDLAQTSRVSLTLASPSGLGSASRTWIKTTRSPSEILDLKVESLQPMRLAMAAGLFLLGLALLALFLWWLL